MKWNNTSTLNSLSFTCGYCKNNIASNTGFFTQQTPYHYIYICHKCDSPTYLDLNKKQTPGASYGSNIDRITDESVKKLYEEARACFSVNSFTACILCCRKILMHVGVDKGAPANKTFISYVEYLDSQNYIPAGSKGWVDFIRTKSNELNHEIIVGSNADAKVLLDFTGMLLKVIYEFPSAIPT